MKSLKIICLAGLLFTPFISSCQTAPATQTGSLSFRVEFPKRQFTTQQIPSQTTQVVFALFEPQSEQPLRYEVLDRENPRVVIAALEAGNKEVMAFALDAQAEVLSGDYENTVVKASQRQQVILELKADWISQLPAARQQALKLLVQQIKQRQAERCQILSLNDPDFQFCPVLQTPDRNPGTGNRPSPTPTPPPLPIPIPTPTATPIIGSGDTAASPQPTPTPAQSNTGSSSGSSGGGGGSSSTPLPSPTPTPQSIPAGSGSANLGTEITVTNGNPAPPPVTIETGGQ